MPSLTFVLPHWMYWSGLVMLPLIAMYSVRWQRKRPRRPRRSLPIGYLLWLWGGFVGLHRFYVRSRLGVLFIPLFLGILYGNLQGRSARNVLSGARNALLGAEFDVERLQKAVAAGTAGAAEKLAQAEKMLATVHEQVAAAAATMDQWQMLSSGLAIAIALFLAYDAFRLPRLIRECNAREEAEPAPEQKVSEAQVFEAEAAIIREDPTLRVHTRFTDLIDAISGWTGEFVCYWSVIAVFVYYYEVLARYVFNSPTNWAHESMFLMFGMQYLLSGAYALREDAHVRVDVIYLLLPDRGKAVTDIVTSVFFFIFTISLLVTGWIFLMDAIAVWEVSFTEWAIQYWPVKITIVLGALLLALQGVSKLIKDFILLTRKEAS